MDCGRWRSRIRSPLAIAVVICTVSASVILTTACGLTDVGRIDGWEREVYRSNSRHVESVSAATGIDTVTLNIYTDYASNENATAEAIDFAERAAAAPEIVEAYPDITVIVYVWPQDGGDPLAELSVTYVDGRPSSPLGDKDGIADK